MIVLPSFKVLLIGPEGIVFGKCNHLYIQSDGEITHFSTLPMSLFERIAVKFHLLSRFLRLGIHHLVADGVGGYYCVYNKMCIRLSSRGDVIGKPVRLVGGRPLKVDVFENKLIYGEYRSNEERSPVSVWSFDGKVNVSLFSLEGPRHIHAVKTVCEQVYFSTGDYGNEAGIRVWDGKDIKTLFEGTQQFRAVDFEVMGNAILYGTDTPLEQNYIYLFSASGETEKVQKVSGSVFYMSNQAGFIWLATAVEPSKYNTHRSVELWCCSRENLRDWVLVDEFKKDIWPMKLFQYGQIQFPYIYDDSQTGVWFYLFGTKRSGSSIQLNNNDVSKKIDSVGNRKD